MADKPVTEVVAASAALDALESPTASDVYEAMLPFSNDAVAAAVGAAAVGGGGGGAALSGVALTLAANQTGLSLGSDITPVWGTTGTDSFETYDTDNYFDGDNPSYVTVPEDGVYDIELAAVGVVPGSDDLLMYLYAYGYGDGFPEFGANLGPYGMSFAPGWDGYCQGRYSYRTPVQAGATINPIVQLSTQAGTGTWDLQRRLTGGNTKGTYFIVTKFGPLPA